LPRTGALVPKSTLPALNCLADIPEQRHRPLGDAGEALAPGIVAHAHVQRRIKRVIERSFIKPARRGLFLFKVGGIEPGGNLTLDRGICRPAIGAVRTTVAIMSVTPPNTIALTDMLAIHFPMFGPLRLRPSAHHISV